MGSQRVEFSVEGLGMLARFRTGRVKVDARPQGVELAGFDWKTCPSRTRSPKDQLCASPAQGPHYSDNTTQIPLL